MKYLVLLSFALLPTLAFAQVDDTLAGLDNYSELFSSLSLWSTLIVAFVTSMMVLIGGRQMHGGVFGSVLNYFSAGMVLIFLGFVTEVPWLQSIPELYLKLTHDSLYIVGYVLMGVAASKLLETIKGE